MFFHSFHHITHLSWMWDQNWGEGGGGWVSLSLVGTGPKLQQDIPLDWKFSHLFDGESCQSFNCCANKSYSAYFEKQTKEKLDQIDMRIVIFLNLLKDYIASNFDLHCRPLKSDIFELQQLQINEFPAFLQHFRFMKLENSVKCNSEHIGLSWWNMEIKVA